MTARDGARLADAPEFDDAIRAAAEYHGILPDLVRKDYWVTCVLRALAADPDHEGRVLFKGGTSLSKGWQLIDRFSEDVDLLLTGPGHGPAPSRAKDREHRFRALKRRIEHQTPLRLPRQGQLTRDEWNFHYFRGAHHCNVRYPLPGRLTSQRGPSTDWLLVEAGFRGGVQPHARRELTSMVAEFIATRPDASDALAAYAADLAPFGMDLLKPERTFAEKLLGLHCDMVGGVEGAGRVRTRHYYDIARVFQRSGDVRECISSGGLAALLAEAVEVSNRYWNAGLDVSNLDIRQSPALRPSDAQARVLTTSFERERTLYYRDRPTFDEILVTMREIREAL